MTDVLADPLVVLPPGISTIADVFLFWEQFIDWERDPRLRLGRQTFEQLAETYSSELCKPASVLLPTALRQIVHRSVGRLLGREPILHEITSSTGILTPEYLGDGDSRELLLNDLSGAWEAGISVLGTRQNHWDKLATDLARTPEDQAFTLLMAPFSPTTSEVRAKYSDWYSSEHLMIVGGQVDRATLLELEELLGFGADRVVWVASEKHKPPRNLSASVSGLAQRGGIAVCITGKVSHAVSGKLRDECKRRGVLLLLVESAASISDELIGRYLVENSDPGPEPG